ncbi:MAG: NAD(P)-dependent oxidoreductase [Nitrospirota bacterium]|nr:NAD(P)-dependent oxidoreductase [Nitrospirota bacterium]MDH5586705.1 NAD(P)-dependent oxidoreductase [Nitrospirota bacterium]MDH5775919.1 NAD(P)-dependent oxidoreductase [Nitrospirota bacterium]
MTLNLADQMSKGMISDSILRFFHGKNVVVTGGSGLIGRQIVNRLVATGASVRSVSLDEIQVNDKVEYLKGDLCDFGFCQRIVKDMDCIFHVAGIKGSIEVTKSKPASFLVPLLMMNTNMLEACRLNKVERVVYTSSIGAYPSAEVFKEAEGEDEGPPMDMFPGWAKRMAELQIQAYKIQYGLQHYAVVRPCNVYGPGDNFDPDNAMVIPTLMRRIFSREDPVVIWGDGTAVRDFAYSEDVADGVILALYHGTGGRYVNLGSGIGYPIKELVETLQRVIPFMAQFDFTKPSGFPRRVMDISLAKTLLGYDPQVSLLEGLQKTWDWYLENHDEYLKRQNYFAAV